MSLGTQRRRGRAEARQSVMLGLPYSEKRRVHGGKSVQKLIGKDLKRLKKRILSEFRERIQKEAI